MNKVLSALAVVFTAATPVVASNALGNLAEAQDIASRGSAISALGGPDAGIAATHDPVQAGAAFELAAHFVVPSIIADGNRELEPVSSIEIAGLLDESIWPRSSAAIGQRLGAGLELHRYGSEAEYTYDCHTEWAVAGDVPMMVCR